MQRENNATIINLQFTRIEYTFLTVDRQSYALAVIESSQQYRLKTVFQHIVFLFDSSL